jgi:hypothetical protein
LLDERRPGWRKKLFADCDLGQILKSTVKGHLGSAEKRAITYGFHAISRAEDERAQKIETVKTRYRKLLVEGSKLVLPRTEKTKITFDPRTLISLDDAGIVYPTLKVISDWGTMDINDGALVSSEPRQITVTAPTKTTGNHSEGPGWTLDRSEGWQLVPLDKGGSFQMQKIK